RYVPLPTAVFQCASPTSSRTPFSVNLTFFASGSIFGSCATIAFRYRSTNPSRQARSHAFDPRCARAALDAPVINKTATVRIVQPLFISLSSTWGAVLREILPQTVILIRTQKEGSMRQRGIVAMIMSCLVIPVLAVSVFAQEPAQGGRGGGRGAGGGGGRGA